MVLKISRMLLATGGPLRNEMWSRCQKDEDVVEHMPLLLRKCLALLIPDPPLFCSMNPPGPSATDIQSHLYNSFIHASTYDVAIRISGRTWRAIYKLHRVVLIQSVRSCSYPQAVISLTIPARVSFALYLRLASLNPRLLEGMVPTR